MLDSIKISATEFINYINASGAAKITVVSNVKEKHENDDDFPYDYWAEFRRALVRTLKKNGSKEDLKEVIEKVKDENRPNHQAMVNGFIKFWGRKDLEWIQPIKRVYGIKGLKISINPEIGLRYNGIDYYIKLFLRSNEVLNRRHADVVTNLMELGLRKKVGDDIVLAVLDVKQGRLFESRGINPKYSLLLQGEASSFLNIWNGL